MAYYDFDPSLDFDAQEQQMLQAAARIKALRAMKTPETSTDEVGGFQSALTPGFKYAGKVQKTPLLNAIAPVLQDYTAGQMEKEVVQNRSAMDLQQQQKLKDWIANTPKAKEAVAAQAAVNPLTPNDDEGNPMPVIPGVAAQEAVPVTREQVLNHAAEGFKAGPLVKSIAQQYLTDQLVKEPEREEARAARKAEKEAATLEAQRKQKEELAYRRERDKEARDLRLQLQQDAIASRQALHAIAQSNRAASGGEKGSDYAIVTNKETGEVYRVPKKPSGGDAQRVAGASGGTSVTQQKDVIATEEKLSAGHTAIAAAPEVADLLDKSSASALKAKVRGAAGFFGYSDDATKAEKQLKVAADPFLKSVPRFSGPTSDGDRKDYAAAAGALSDPTTPPEDRKAALTTLIKLQKKAVDEAQAKLNSKKGGSAGGGWVVEEVE